MNFLPISIDIEHETILIIGGGKLAIHKIESLERFTRKIKVIAKDVLPEITDRGFIEVLRKDYEAADLEGHLLVYAATESNDFNTQVRKDGRLYRCLVNVVDVPDNCDFVSPAITKSGPMTVAVSSNGENVYATIKWRNSIRELMEEELLLQTKTKNEYREEFHKNV
ncbi:bifunctional precorrin-2 dehydrogenase/sirohydrochlorin ferrochelatase [Carboxylicivirga sp. M1479]|uniref:precorrin-2 dehydrogenase/sirohydrochlorin ferrochelatase family protein n=1 Tax=Carboxylicivirga sp. M1479 TaxID=2594476 RepID=UPI0011778AEF|nr:bifunctional precorrin-2 dehydrogenase/sirohydrochlorin ferrochelatase [Carboxylicivirga sp. M1479]TRX65971.1 bifunctional precorrin-2 dehydrogenase/sirohydrochlorin ferrochelatase [Carboxylicivirga sp. M1479]